MSRMLSLFSSREPVDRLPRAAVSAFADALRILGDGHFAAERYKLARRNYLAALRVEPRNALLALKLAAAWEDDPYGSDEKALRCYKRAVKYDATNANAWARLARCAQRLDRKPQAQNAMHQAVKLAPADARVLSVVLEVLRESGQIAKAWSIITKARFLAPQSAAIRSLWDRVRFDRAAKCQVRPSGKELRGTLPFLRIAGNWRMDSLSDFRSRL